jgi:ribosomal protein L37E
VTCPDPAFKWNGSTWSFCTRCGRAAWDHEQSDPLADLRNVRNQVHASPVMRSVGYLVVGEHCDRCGDTNYDPHTRICLTCTYPDDPSSRAYLECRP